MRGSDARGRSGTSLISLAIVLGLAAGCANSSKNKKSPEPANDTSSLTLFITTELRGTIEPCGCNSDPLGDLARTAQLIAETGKTRAVAHIDGGSALYTIKGTIPERLVAQEQLKAKLLRSSFAGTLRTIAVGLGPYDLTAGAAAIQQPRHAANVQAPAPVPIAPPRVVRVGDVPVGVFGVVGPDPALAKHKIVAGDPAAAATAAIATLRGQGARVIVGLFHMPRAKAIKLARTVKGVDFVVAGAGAPEPDHVSIAPTKVGATWVVQPANRGQVVTRLDIGVRGNGAFADAIGEVRAKQTIAKLDEQLAHLNKQLAAWKANSGADPQFLKAKQEELDRLSSERDSLRTRPTRIPADGNWFTMEQIRIRKALPCHGGLQQAKLEYDKAAGAANVAAAKAFGRPAADKGKPGYAGIEECGSCHRKAVDFWKKTKHAQAWKTLVDVGKQHDYDCTSCHVTGWDKPGGSNMAFTKGLVDVQCETCHGPGSFHVAEDGKESPRTMTRTPPEGLCKGCHNQEHSDTFDYTAYLRDVTGPGHGEALRKSLGDGVTGHTLRSAALKKAGATIGAGCRK